MTLISYLARTHFSEAAIEDALPEEVGQNSRALLLVDDEPAGAIVTNRVREALNKTILSVARSRPSSSPEASLSRILEALQTTRSAMLIAVGGTSALSQARLAVGHALRRGERLTLIAVPAGLGDFGLARRVRFGEGQFVTCPRPDCIIADPTVLGECPAPQLAASAMEVLVHAVEAYASPGYNPPADALALEAINRLTHWLPLAINASADEEARRELMAAALTAGLSLEKAFGGVDAFAHPIKAELGTDVLSGALHAPLMAAMAEFNGAVVGDRYATMANSFENTGRQPHFSAGIGAFARIVGLPASLRETGVDRAAFDRLAQIVANDAAALANPRRLTPVDCRQILEAAW